MLNIWTGRGRNMPRPPAWLHDPAPDIRIAAKPRPCLAPLPRLRSWTTPCMQLTTAPDGGCPEGFGPGGPRGPQLPSRGDLEMTGSTARRPLFSRRGFLTVGAAGFGLTLGDFL